VALHGTSVSLDERRRIVDSRRDERIYDHCAAAYGLRHSRFALFGKKAAMPNLNATLSHPRCCCVYRKEVPNVVRETRFLSAPALQTSELELLESAGGSRETEAGSRQHGVVLFDAA
jgi:hypothetical protein